MHRWSRVVLVVAMTACASAGSGTTAGGAARRSMSVITAEEIAENPGILSAYDLISRLRPNYLRGTAEITGSQSIQVRVDNGPQREVGDLRSIDVRQVQEIRYYTPQEANVRFGVDTNVPVVAITMKRLK